MVGLKETTATTAAPTPLSPVIANILTFVVSCGREKMAGNETKLMPSILAALEVSAFHVVMETALVEAAAYATFLRLANRQLTSAAAATDCGAVTVSLSVLVPDNEAVEAPRPVQVTDVG